MYHRLMAFCAGVAVAATLAAGSSAGTLAPCVKPPRHNPYGSLCVYFTGRPSKTPGEYVMTLHYYNAGSKPIKQQINAYAQAGIDLDKVASHAPSKISSPVKYSVTNDEFTPLARIIGIPGGLKPHQDLELKLTYTGLLRPSPNTVGGIAFDIQFWTGALVPKNYPKSGYSLTVVPLNT